MKKIQKKLVLIYSFTIMLWIVSSAIVWFITTAMTTTEVYDSRLVHPGTDVEYTTYSFLPQYEKKLGEMSQLHQLVWSYYNYTETCDYTNDLWGNEKPMSKGMFNFLFAGVFFLMAYIFTKLMERFSSGYKFYLISPLLLITLAIPIAITAIKAEFLIWTYFN